MTEHAHRRAGGFSLGMRQRLGLAAALLGEPSVLILDEPANGLDPEGVYWLRTFLRSQADAGRTIVVSSHLLAEVAQTVDHVVILDKGRLITSARSPSSPPGPLRRHPPHPRRRPPPGGPDQPWHRRHRYRTRTDHRHRHHPRSRRRVIGTIGLVIYEMRLEAEPRGHLLLTHQY